MARRGYTKKEASRRRTKFMVLAGMGDFVGTVAAFFVILACVVLLSDLLRLPRATINYRLKKAKMILKQELEDWYFEDE